MVNPQNRGDGGSVGAEACFRVLVSEHSARFCHPVRLAHLCRAGVQVAQEYGLMIGLALVLVCFSHD